MLISPAELERPATVCAERLAALLKRIADSPPPENTLLMSNVEAMLRARSPDCPPDLAALPGNADAAAILRSLGSQRLAALNYEWPLWARPLQLPPDTPWRTFLARSGRGSGKTRLASEWVRKRKNHCPVIAIVADNAADFRETVVKGESGVLQCSPPWDRPVYKKSDRALEWRNGARAIFYSAEEPDSLRGPNNSAAWVDELAKFRYAPEVWEQLQLTMRAFPKDGKPPQVVVTTTPRPIPLMKTIISDPTTVMIVERTFDNAANLAPAFIGAMESLRGTSRGRQELDGELLDEAQGALWTRQMIEQTRVTDDPGADFWKETAIGLDPQAGRGASSTGIVAVSKGADGHGYVRADASGELSPADWARRACELYYEMEADYIVAEVNQGGEMVESVIRTHDRKVQVVKVRAAQGKQARAEPVVMLYEQGRAHMLGHHGPLEDQLTAWVPTSGDASPDRLDAMVWAFRRLFWGHNERTAGGLPEPVRVHAGVPL